MIEAVVEEPGLLRGVLRLCWQFRNSVSTQRVTLSAHSPRIDFCTEVQPHNQQVHFGIAPYEIKTWKVWFR